MISVDMKVTNMAFDKDKSEIYSKAIMKVVIPFIEKDQYHKDVSNQVYEVQEYRIHFSLIKKPYVYCWIKVLDRKEFYNGKNKVHRHLYVKNPEGHNPDYIKFLLDVKEF